jgi:hypothetical protein
MKPSAARMKNGLPGRHPEPQFGELGFGERVELLLRLVLEAGFRGLGVWVIFLVGYVLILRPVAFLVSVLWRPESLVLLFFAVVFYLEAKKSQWR